jgi:predicted PurR-regulated permease PerM
MDLKLTPRRLYGAAIVALSIWFLHGFVHGLLAASVAAIASWPLYERFSACVRRHVGKHVTAFMFTAIITAFVLAPLVFALWSLLSESHVLFRQIAGADERGIVLPQWLQGLPLLGSWQRDLSSPGALLGWTHRTNAAAFLGVLQSLGQFAARHLLILLFTILLLFFLYDQGESLARDLRCWLRQGIGEQAERHVDVVTRAVRASVNSMLAVGLFDGLATGSSYAVAGVPRAAVWGAIIGAIAAVPFLGYAVVAALALRIAIEGQVPLALLLLALGWTVLLAGDKVIRPLVARGGIHLPFVWILMACLGGFEVLGLVGLVIGPVVLALARELWDQRLRELDRAQARVTPPPIHSNESLSCTTPVPTSTTCEAS